MYNIDLQLTPLFLQKEMSSHFDMLIAELTSPYQASLKPKESKLLGGFCAPVVTMNSR